MAGELVAHVLGELPALAVLAHPRHRGRAARLSRPSRRPGGKVKFWVAEVNAEGKLSSTSTQRSKLTLNPTLGTDGAK